MFEITEGQYNQKNFKKLKTIKKSFDIGIYNGLKESKQPLLEFAKKSMLAKKHGRLYKVYVSRSGRRLKRGRWHTASKKGESPGVISGALMRSLSVTQKNRTMLTFGAGVLYAKYLEPSRPFLIESIKANEKVILKNLQREISTELLR